MIPGISDVARLPRLGKIRLGEKRKSSSGKEYPAALDHFKLDDVPWVTEVYGATPKELDIVLPAEDESVFFPQALMCYRTSGLFCKCDDGQTATRVRLPEEERAKDPQGEAAIKESGEKVASGAMYNLPCTHELCPFFEKKFCKPIGRFLFMLPKVNRFGCYEIDTTSWHSMVNLNNYIRAIRATAGRISMIPLKLRLVPIKATAEGKAKTVHVLELVYEGSTFQLAGLRQRALPSPVAPAAMPEFNPTDVPDDLMPNGGESLDVELGAAKPAPSKTVSASEARKALALGGAKPAAAPAEPEPQAAEPKAEPKPAPKPAPQRKGGAPW